MDAFTVGLGIVAIAALMRRGGSAPKGAEKPQFTVGGLIDSLKSRLTDEDRIVGHLREDEPDWALVGDCPDALLWRQLWFPASLIHPRELTPEDYALALIFSGAVADAPTFAKGSAAGCPIGNYEQAIRNVNKRFSSEAQAAGGIGEVVTAIVGAFGVNVEGIDESIGLGRAEKEVNKAQFDLSKLAGLRAGDLRILLSWDTPLDRHKAGDPSEAGPWQEILRDSSGNIVRQGSWPNGEPRTTWPKDGQIYLFSDAGEIDPKLTEINHTKVHAAVRCRVAPGIGPAFRPGLFALEWGKNTPSAGTIDHETRWKDALEWALPWNSKELSCRGGLKQRAYVRARIYRALDAIACMMLPIDPEELIASGPVGYRKMVPAKDALKGKLYWTKEQAGTIFPPVGEYVVGDGRPRLAVAPGATPSNPGEIYKVNGPVAAAPSRPASAAPAPPLERVQKTVDYTKLASMWRPKL